jgi:hypothetical protein
MQTPTTETAMKKNAKKRTSKKEASSSRQTVLRLAPFIQRRLHAFIIEQGLKALNEQLETDRTELCGPRYARSAEGDGAVRWGATDGELVMGGRRIIVNKPRVRRDGKEVTLPSWAEYENEEGADPILHGTLHSAVTPPPSRPSRQRHEDGLVSAVRGG